MDQNQIDKKALEELIQEKNDRVEAIDKEIERRHIDEAKKRYQNEVENAENDVTGMELYRTVDELKKEKRICNAYIRKYDEELNVISHLLQ